MKHLDKRKIAGWIAVVLSTVFTCLWALWGILENFHEGWYYESLLRVFEEAQPRSCATLVRELALALDELQRLVADSQSST